MIEVKPLPENEETLKELQALSADLQDKAIKSALKVSAKPLADAMVSNAPDDPATAGTRLARAINVTQAKKGTRVRTGVGGRVVDVKEGELGVVVGPNKKTGGIKVDWLAWMLEVGTKGHKISSKNNILKLGPRFLRKPVWHPGIRPRAWMDKSFRSASSQIEQQFYVGLERYLDKNGR